MTITIRPVDGENYEGRQWGYSAELNGVEVFRCWTGGTGPCWNIDLRPGDLDESAMHICDLDEMIEALTALRDSDAHKQNVERWA